MGIGVVNTGEAVVGNIRFGGAGQVRRGRRRRQPRRAGRGMHRGGPDLRDDGDAFHALFPNLPPVRAFFKQLIGMRSQ
jgi:hypothetical protein